ncbi:Sigma-fimbriae chaperone protein [Collimonas arenae]|uniref:Sigma-fimbriae chaperone protein n=1 Tax=Collimonas arenae TaxID=279058 RepID=A0A0A1F9F0_9BURK|nr:molecular chaperone [Collimonas arenae]AIY41363.1 Sigma-fimbriae chaperone protein [Collimonas arenae]
MCGSLLICLLAAVGKVDASGLQVAPTTVSLKATQNADGLWLSNTGDNVVHAQVRVYHWTQDGQGDQLTPSRGLVISPPMLELGIGERQLIRIIRTGAPPNGADAVEDAYRLAIDELPIDTSGKKEQQFDTPSKKGLQFVLHYSVPIFVEPVATSIAPSQLQWSLERDGDHVMLVVSNRGGSHAQLAGLNYVDPTGRRTEITPGLLGYVLPGATMRWMLKPSAAVFAAGGTLEAMINGAKSAQHLSLADRSR